MGSRLQYSIIATMLASPVSSESETRINLKPLLFLVEIVVMSCLGEIVCNCISGTLDFQFIQPHAQPVLLQPVRQLAHHRFVFVVMAEENIVVELSVHCLLQFYALTSINWLAVILFITFNASGTNGCKSSIRFGNQNNDADFEVPEILLVLQILIGSDQDFESSTNSQSEQFAVFYARPTHLCNMIDIMAEEIEFQRSWHTFIKQDFHDNDSRDIPDRRLQEI